MNAPIAGAAPVGTAPPGVPEQDVVTLAVDASTYVGSVAVLRGDVVVAQGITEMRGEVEERLMPAIAQALASAGCPVRAVSRVVCGAGPGSFTSLRIAAAIAKGVALGNSAVVRETPLFAVSSLALIVAGAEPLLEPGRYLALLDARRGERYAALFDVDVGGGVRELSLPGDGRIAEERVAGICAEFGAQPLGPRESLRAAPHARGVARLLREIVEAGPVPLDRREPGYGRVAEAQRKWEADHGLALPRGAG